MAADLGGKNLRELFELCAGKHPKFDKMWKFLVTKESNYTLQRLNVILR